MRTVQTALFVLTLLVHAARADYVIRWTLEMLGETQEVTMKIKGGQSRWDSTGLSFLLSSKSDKITVLNHLNKTYSNYTGEWLKRFLSGLIVVGDGDKKGIQEATDVKPTGRTETINGYKTEEFIASLGGLNVRLFVDKDFPTDKYDVRQALSSPAFDAFQEFGPVADKCSGMPIRVMYDLSGLMMATMTLESIQETSLLDADFQIPADYKAG